MKMLKQYIGSPVLMRELDNIRCVLDFCLHSYMLDYVVEKMTDLD